MKKIKLQHEFVNEARSINKISKELGAVTARMKELADEFYDIRSQGEDADRIEEIKNELRELTPKKKALIAELDDSVAGKDRNIELAIEESVVTEAEDAKKYKQFWDKGPETQIRRRFGKEYERAINNRVNLLLTLVEDPDKAESYAEMDFLSLPDIISTGLLNMDPKELHSILDESVVNEKSIKGWFLSNIDSFEGREEYMKAGKKAGFSKKELQDAADDFEQGGESYLESVTEAKFVKDFDKKVLGAETEKDILKVYPNAETYVGKHSHFFGELEPNLFYKAYYKDYITTKVKDFLIVSIYSKKGSNYEYLYNESPQMAKESVNEATVVMDAIDPKSNVLKKLLKKHNVKIKVLTMNGPGGGNPEVEMTGSREDLQAVLAAPKGWDDPELGEYIKESANEHVSQNYRESLNEKFNFSEAEVKAAAEQLAKAMSNTDKVKVEVHDFEYDKGKGAGFELSWDGDKHDGGSYGISDNGDVINYAIGGKGGTKYGTITSSQRDFEKGIRATSKVREGKLTEAVGYKKGDKIEYQLTHKGGVGKYANATSKSKNTESGVIKKKTKGIGGTYKYLLTSGLELYGSEILGLAENFTIIEEKLAKGLKPLLKLGSTISKKDGEEALLNLSDKFDRIDDEYAGTISSWLDMAIELMQDGYSGDATKKLKEFNKKCKDVIGGKDIGSAFENELTEKRIQTKRKYTENHPAKTVGSAAKIRNKILEALKDGKLTQNEFDTLVKELSSDHKRWMKRNGKMFNVSEDGISLSKFGKRILSGITINESKPVINESFASFVNSLNE